jgi:putative ABC transport system permease protein
MLWRLLRRSIQERLGHAILAVLAVAAGAALAAALLGVAFEIRERMAKELRAFGANILVVPKGEPLEVSVGSLRHVAPRDEAYLAESDLARVKTIFWRHNIVSLVPFLSRTVEVRGERVLLVGTWFEKEIQIPRGQRQFSFATGGRREVASAEGRWRTGLRSLATSWQVEGAWVEEGTGEALVGRALATRLGLRPGQTVEVRAQGRSARFLVRGILRTGGIEEDQVVVELARVQALFDLPDKVEKVQVSALVTPDNALALRARKVGAARLPPNEYETWYCTPYLDSILFQIEEALPGAKGKAIRQVAEAEEAFLGRVTLAFALISAVGLLAATLAVAATMARAMFERRREVGLMKALGGERRQIALLFLLEAALTGLAGGGLGYFLGTGLAGMIGVWVFAAPTVAEPLLLPAILGVAVGIALLGVLVPLRDALRVRPVVTLRGE